MGTRFELVLAGGDPVHLRAAGEEALRLIEETDQRLSLFRRDSQLAHINRTAYARDVRLDLDTFDLLAVADLVARATGGAFDPSVAPLLRALGLHGERSTVHALEPDEASALVGWCDGVILDPSTHTVRFGRPGVALDLGGIAKGHALDLAVAALRENGVEQALLHGGTSTVVALGTPPGEEAWRVKIGNGEDAPIADLADTCLSVSAPAGRMARRGDRDLHHLIDPRTKTSSEGARLAAVVAPSACHADAWSTALLIAPEFASTIELESLISTGRDADWQHNAPRTPRITCVPVPA